MFKDNWSKKLERMPLTWPTVLGLSGDEKMDLYRKLNKQLREYGDQKYQGKKKKESFTRHEDKNNLASYKALLVLQP